MGSRYLTDLADVCRHAGLDTIEVEGWQTRARGSGGYDSGRPTHVMCHHTASPPSSDGWPDVNYCTYGDDDAPLCNLYVNRSGSVWVSAAGATNTNGSGQDPCGVTPDDSMNSHAIGIEAGSSGTGERWPDAQCDAYLKLVNALCSAYAIPTSRAHSHREWTERKVDPAGPDRWASGSATWDMDDFRADLAPSGGGSTPPPTPPTPPTDEDEMPTYMVRAKSGSDVQKAAIFWWDGKQIGWIRTTTQEQTGSFVGMYLLGGDDKPLANFSASEIQQMIDSGWSGGPLPPGFTAPAKVDSGTG